MTDRIDPFDTYDAAYVLGALTEQDSAAYESHLRECVDCRQSVARFASLPRLLAGADLTDSQPRMSGPAMPDTLLPSLLRAARRSRRRRRMAAGAVAAAVAAGLVTGTALVAASDSPAPVGPPVALSTVTAVPLQASLNLRPTDWGSELTMKCRYSGYLAPDGASYELVVVPRAGGAAQTVARWSVIPGKEATVVGSTDLTPADIGQVQIRSSNGTILLRS